MRATFLLVSPLLAGLCLGAAAQPLAESIPSGAMVYAETKGLAPHIAGLRRSELVAEIQASPEFAAMQASADYANFQKGRKAIELVLGMNLWSAAQKLLGGELGVALYPKPDSEQPEFLVVVRPASQLAYFRQKIWLGPALAVGGERIEDGVLAETEGIKAWKTEGEGGKPAFLMLGKKWFAASTRRELLEQAVALEETGKGVALAADENYALFEKRIGGDRLGRVYFDSGTFAKAAAPRLGIPEKADEGFASFMFGGLMELVANSPQLGLSFNIENDAMNIELAGSGDPAKLPERFSVFFTGPPKTGSRPIPQVEGLVAGGTLYRDLGSWYRGREDYLQAKVLPGFDKFETGIGNLLPGRDIGEDVLPLFGSNFAFVSALQSYPHLDGKPGVQLPGFAVIASLEKPEEATDLMQLFFQTLLSVLNFQAAEQKRQPWLIETELYADTKITYARYLEKPAGEALPTVFNFQPAAARVGDEYLLCSSVELCRSLIDALQKTDRKTVATEDIVLTLKGENLVSLAAANRQHLEAAQVGKGRNADEARRDIDGLLRLLGRFDGLQLSTRAAEDGFSVRLKLEATPAPAPAPLEVADEIIQAE